jgi:hypothetical protein
MLSEIKGLRLFFKLALKASALLEGSRITNIILLSLYFAEHVCGWHKPNVLSLNSGRFFGLVRCLRQRQVNPQKYYLSFNSPCIGFKTCEAHSFRL